MWAFCEYLMNVLKSFSVLGIMNIYVYGGGNYMQSRWRKEHT